MPNIRTIISSFVGGEISSELFGRVDLVQVHSGLQKCRNFIVKDSGSVSTRPGTRFVRAIKFSNSPVRLISFSFSDSQTFAIELGAGYFRFHNNAGTLVSGVSPYEIANSYLQSELYDIRYVQSGDVITLVHPNHPPKELKRLGNLNWTLSNITFSSQTATPTGVAAVKTQPTAGTNTKQKYVVTALNSYGFEESLASTPSNELSNDLTISGNFNTVSWTAVSGAIRYNIYKYAQGVYGYIGQVNATSFVDDNILADLTRTIPIQDNYFSSAGNYPSAVCYYQQRRFFANSLNQPMNIWSTQSSSDYNMGYSIPSQSADALRFKISAQRANAVLHLIPAQDLIALTSSTEWKISGGNADSALTPQTISVKPQSQNGCNSIIPVVIGNYLLYVQSLGSHIREMVYQWQNASYTSNDLCLLAPHLFVGKTIIDIAFTRSQLTGLSPNPILWVLLSDGNLLGLTYEPEQKVTAWHRHDTVNGFIESICTVTESGGDSLYLSVRRVINGNTVRYIERLENVFKTDIANQYFVDCGLSYAGAAATHFAGLEHLEGQTVSILADGAVMPNQVVVSGAIDLSHSAAVVHVGLPINAEIITMPITFSGDPAYGYSRVKAINNIWVRVNNSGIFEAGPDETRLTPIKARSFEPMGSPPDLKSAEIELFLQPSFNQEGQIMIKQDLPLPLTVVYIVAEVTVGS